MRIGLPVPKAEGRGPKEGRRPKPEAHCRVHTARGASDNRLLTFGPLRRKCLNLSIGARRIRNSVFGLLSGFGHRPSDFAFCAVEGAGFGRPTTVQADFHCYMFQFDTNYTRFTQERNARTVPGLPSAP